MGLSTLLHRVQDWGCHAQGMGLWLAKPGGTCFIALISNASLRFSAVWPVKGCHGGFT
jgi:hypothetical protein